MHAPPLLRCSLLCCLRFYSRSYTLIIDSHHRYRYLYGDGLDHVLPQTTNTYTAPHATSWAADLPSDARNVLVCLPKVSGYLGCSASGASPRKLLTALRPLRLTTLDASSLIQRLMSSDNPPTVGLAAPPWLFPRKHSHRVALPAPQPHGSTELGDSAASAAIAGTMATSHSVFSDLQLLDCQLKCNPSS